MTPEACRHRDDGSMDSRLTICSVQRHAPDPSCIANEHHRRYDPRPAPRTRSSSHFATSCSALPSSSRRTSFPTSKRVTSGSVLLLRQLYASHNGQDDEKTPQATPPPVTGAIKKGCMSSIILGRSRFLFMFSVESDLRVCVFATASVRLS